MGRPLSARLRALVEARAALPAAMGAWVREVLAVLPGALPAPAIVVVDRLGEGWLGACVYRPGEDNTRIQLQRRILGDEATLRRVIAHELCHHAEFLTAWGAAQAVGQSARTFAMLQRMGGKHGAGFLAQAALLNARYGAGYVTPHTDEAMQVQDASREVQVVLWHRGAGQDLLYAVAAGRLGPKQQRYLAYKAGAYDAAQYRVARTRDARVLGGAKVGEGFSPARGPLGEALRALWDAATPLAAPAPMAEGKTPHGGAAIKVQRPRAADPYTRHAVVAIVGGLRKKTPPRRSDAPTAHAIARGVAALHHGPKLPYFKRTKPHAQTPRGRKFIQKHQRDRNHGVKDAKYYKLVGKRRAEFEGPWTLKGEGRQMPLSQQLRMLVEGKPYAMTPELAAKIERGLAERAALPLWRVQVARVTMKERTFLMRRVAWPTGATMGPWERAAGPDAPGVFLLFAVPAASAGEARMAIEDAIRAAYEDQTQNGVDTPTARMRVTARPA